MAKQKQEKSNTFHRKQLRKVIIKQYPDRISNKKIVWKIQMQANYRWNSKKKVVKVWTYFKTKWKGMSIQFIYFPAVIDFVLKIAAMTNS